MCGVLCTFFVLAEITFEGISLAMQAKSAAGDAKSSLGDATGSAKSAGGDVAQNAKSAVGDVKGAAQSAGRQVDQATPDLSANPFDDILGKVSFAMMQKLNFGSPPRNIRINREILPDSIQDSRRIAG